AAFYFLKTTEIKEFLKDPQEQKQIIGKCIESLGSTVSEILNPAISFTADNEDTTYCAHCPFSRLCK
ncbi:unnamed protein product, partial [marine sediment metagenome]